MNILFASKCVGLINPKKYFHLTNSEAYKRGTNRRYKKIKSYYFNTKFLEKVIKINIKAFSVLPLQIKLRETFVRNIVGKMV